MKDEDTFRKYVLGCNPKPEPDCTHIHEISVTKEGIKTFSIDDSKYEYIGTSTKAAPFPEEYSV